MSAIELPSGWVVSAFVALFAFRYLRFLVHVVAYLLYRPTPPSYNGHDSTALPSDVTAVMATVEPDEPEFEITVRSTLNTGCAELIVVTVDDKLRQTQKLCETISSHVIVLASSHANKRVQLCIGLRHVQTSIVLFVDDHVWFEKPWAFIETILAPFNDPRIGGVAVGKRVARLKSLSRFSIADMLNFIACLYLERHNFDLAATNTIDGGVFVISGRTAAYRSSIICSNAFMEAFLNEFWFFGIGPLHADDDNCITRWLVSHDWKIKFQHANDALMHTVLGDAGFQKFNSQCIRWVRTTWRSNATSLFSDGAVWYSQPWCVYAVYISSFLNFALLIDSALMLLGIASFDEVGIGKQRGVGVLVAWILCSKLVKLLPYLKRHPRDIAYFPVYVLFAYYHSFLKLWALLTVGSLSWGSRPNIVP